MGAAATSLFYAPDKWSDYDRPQRHCHWMRYPVCAPCAKRAQAISLDQAGLCVPGLESQCGQGCQAEEWQPSL